MRDSESVEKDPKIENKCGSKEGHKGACRKQGKVGWAWVVEEGGGGGVLAGRVVLLKGKKDRGGFPRPY